MAKARTAEIDIVETDAVEAILDVEKALRNNLINRSEVIRALILGVVSEQNILIEGPPGTAKTLMGSLFASYVRSDEFMFFKTQLMKGSVPEQLFGPLNVTKMRQESIWEYNTAKMLPTAHFAMLEEVYRAPEMLLSSMLTVLNERMFHNGHKVDRCPLICAIGTTNFVSGGEETEAFNDRWLIRCKVDQLKSADDRLRMLLTATLPQGSKLERADISLDQIRELHLKRRAVTIPAELLQLYEQIVAALQRKGMSIPITDRRIVQSLSLVKSSAVIGGRVAAVPEDLIAAEYGLTVKGNVADAGTFATVFQSTVVNYQKLIDEGQEMDKIEQRAKQVESLFDPKLTPDKLKKLQQYSKQMLQSMETRDPTFVSSANRDRFNAVQANVERILRECTEALN